MLTAVISGDRWKILTNLLDEACMEAEANYVYKPRLSEMTAATLFYLLRDQRISHTITLSTDN